MVKWRGRYFRCVLMVLFLFSIIFSSMIFSLQEVEAINDAPISLQIDDSKYFAQLNGEDDAIIYITGSIQYDMAGLTTPYQSVSVKIFAVSPYFNTSEDEEFTFTNDTEMTCFFNITLTVPYNTHVGSYYTNIGCEYLLDNGTQHNVSHQSRNIYVWQYYKVTVGIPDGITVKAGGSGQSLISIYNEGNGPDKPRIQVNNMKELYNRGWKIQLSQNKCPLPANMTVTIPIFVEIPSDEKSGKYNIELLVVSSQAESANETGYFIERSIEVKVQNNYRDEVILVSIIGLPIAFILLLAISLVFIKRRMKKMNSKIKNI